MKKIDNSHNGYNGKRLKSEITFYDCLALALVLAFLLLIGSCTSTKQVTKQTTTVDSSYVKELEEQNRVLSSENDRLETENNEMRFASVEFDSTKCPPSQLIIDSNCNADSIRNLLRAEFENEIKIYADGTIEAKGRLKRANYTMQQVQRLLSEQNRTIDSLKTVKQKERVKVVTNTVTKEVYKKKSFMSQWWIWLLIGIGIGFFAAWKLLAWVEHGKNLEHSL